MARFEIRIWEVADDVSPGPLDPSQPTPEVRSVVTTTEASDEAEATAAAWNVWDAKYGLDKRPSEGAARVEVKSL